jgi:hypothetical protein
MTLLPLCGTSEASDYVCYVLCMLCSMYAMFYVCYVNVFDDYVSMIVCHLVMYAMFCVSMILSMIVCHCLYPFDPFNDYNDV